MPSKLRLRKINGTLPQGKAKVRLLERKLNDAASPFMELATKRETSAQLSDPFVDYYNEGVGSQRIIEPVYDPLKLIYLGMQNSTLNQCIQAYVVNIESYGYQLEYIGPEGKENSAKAQRQKRAAMAFLEMPNGERSLREVREHSRSDLEYTGNRYFEIGRDLAGRISYLDYVVSPTMRMTKKDAEPTPYFMPVPNPDGDGYVVRQFSKHFRRYVQVSSTGKKVFFKEFGDPRPIDPDTGEVNPNLAIEDQATEIWHHALYMPGTPYGVPRWVGAMLMMLGVREAELVNLNYFRENAIPAMAVLISGGALTSESFDNVTNIINAARGKDAMNRILILEAAADDAAGTVDGNAPAPKIEMKPMGHDRQQDAQFKEYQIEGKRAIRSSMRLPAIYTGDTEEYTKATAQSGKQMAEAQVFFPERTVFDEFINNRVFPTWGIDMWQYKSMGPTVYDADQLSVMIDRFARHGALTPNILVKLANQVFDVQIPAVKEGWGDVPFTYTLELARQGHIAEGFEETLAQISDLAGTTAEPQETEPVQPPQAGDPANDNPQAAQVAALKRMIRKELGAIASDLIDRVNDAMEVRAAA